jgi:hypothetical protein
MQVRSTAARHAIRLQLAIDTNTFEIRAIQSPNCIVWRFVGRTYHLRIIPEGVAKRPQTIVRDIHISPNSLNYEKSCKRDRW